MNPPDSSVGRGDGTVPDLPAGVAGIRNARVLLVEDNELNQIVAREILTHAGLKIDLAVNGEEAVRAVMTNPGAYDAVLMDMRMPVMDGFDAIKAIRGEFSKEDLPIISTTAGGVADERERCLAVGANDYLPKPFLVTDICAILIRWIPAATRGSAEIGEAEENAGVDEDGDETGDRADVDLPARIDGVDLNAGLARTMGNRALYASLLADFARTNETLGDKVAKAMAEEAVEHARIFVHSVVSTAGNIGADELAAIAGELQAAILSESDRLADLLLTFRTQLDRVVGAIGAADISSEPDLPARPKDGGPFSPKEAARLLEELANMLDDQDLAAPDRLDELASMLAGRGHDKILKRVRASLAALDFSAARDILERARADLVA